MRRIRMFEELINKLVVVEFDRKGQHHRTIARLVSARDGFIELQSPTKKEIYAISINQLLEINELSPNKIRPGLV
jgi:hypothetical protein